MSIGTVRGYQFTGTSIMGAHTAGKTPREERRAPKAVFGDLFPSFTTHFESEKDEMNATLS